MFVTRWRTLNNVQTFFFVFVEIFNVALTWLCMSCLALAAFLRASSAASATCTCFCFCAAAFCAAAAICRRFSFSASDVFHVPTNRTYYYEGGLYSVKINFNILFGTGGCQKHY